MLASKTFSNLALIIKRRNYGETDRLVTLISQERGKFMVLAKGVRKLNSSKSAYLEPGNLVQAFFVKTKAMPLLTQAKLIKNTANILGSLNKIRRLTQVLEIFDRLLVEEELESNIFNQILKIRKMALGTYKVSQVQVEIGILIELLGFGETKMSQNSSVVETVAQISEKPMRAFCYLKVK